MFKFSYLQDGEIVEIDFDPTALDRNPLKEFYKSQVLNNEDNFNEILYCGIYQFENITADSSRTDRPSNLESNGYLFVFAESEFKNNRAVIQICFAESNSKVFYRKGLVNKGVLTADNWKDISDDSNSFAITTSNPAQTVGGIWDKEDDFDSKPVSLWSQVNNGIQTMSLDASTDTNVLLDISTLALSGAQELYLRDTDNAFKKMMLDISCGGTGASTAAGALSALGAASAADLQSVQDSLNYYPSYYGSALSSIRLASWYVSQSYDMDPFQIIYYSKQPSNPNISYYRINFDSTGISVQLPNNDAIHHVNWNY